MRDTMKETLRKEMYVLRVSAYFWLFFLALCGAFA